MRIKLALPQDAWVSIFVHNRHKNGHIALYNNYRKLEDMKSENHSLGNQTRNLAFHKQDL